MKVRSEGCRVKREIREVGGVGREVGDGCGGRSGREGGGGF